jgi:hypothetical protein
VAGVVLLRRLRRASELLLGLGPRLVELRAGPSHPRLCVLEQPGALRPLGFERRVELLPGLLQEALRLLDARPRLGQLRVALRQLGLNLLELLDPPLEARASLALPFQLGTLLLEALAHTVEPLFGLKLHALELLALRGHECVEPLAQRAAALGSEDRLGHALLKLLDVLLELALHSLRSGPLEFQGLRCLRKRRAPMGVPVACEQRAAEGVAGPTDLPLELRQLVCPTLQLRLEAPLKVPLEAFALRQGAQAPLELPA